MAYVEGGRWPSNEGRVVRGSRMHTTMEEKRGYQPYVEPGYAASPTVNYTDARVLLPRIENFVETDEVRALKERVKLWSHVGFSPHIVGPTGCGKTTLAMWVAKEIGTPTVWINGDEQMTTRDLIGGYSEIETASVRDRFVHNVFISKDKMSLKWVDNPLTIACKHGYTLVYNEFSRSKPEANNILLSVLEENLLELPTMFGEERYIEVHPDFKIIFTSNSIEYAGVFRPQDALLDRMVDIYMDYYNFETETQIVQAHTGMPRAEAEKIVTAVRKIREGLDDPYRPGTRADIMIAKGLRALNGYSKEIRDQIFMDVLATKIGAAKELEKQRDLITAVIGEVYA